MSYEDFESFDGLDVGVLAGSAMKDIFYNYQKQNDFSCNMVEYVSENEMLEALNSGKIDAMCTEHLVNHQELTLLSRFGADAYYLMSYKGSPYITDINFALQEIKTDVDFETDLFHKYFDSSTAATALVFSSSEKEYIAKSKTIRVGMNGDRAPFCSYDEKTGKFTGICVDVMDEIAKNSGLKFKYVMQEPGVTTVDQLAGGKYDIICGIERDNFATNVAIASTEAFMESSIVPVGKAGKSLDLNDKLTAAVPSAFQALIKTLEKNYPNIKIVGYDTNRECLDAVVNGDADIFIQNTHLLSILLQEPKYENINILPVEVMTENTAIAVPRSNNQMLISILNKSITNINEATIDESLIEHTFASPYRYTFKDFV